MEGEHKYVFTRACRGFISSLQVDVHVPSVLHPWLLLALAELNAAELVTSSPLRCEPLALLCMALWRGTRVLLILGG